MMHHELTAKGPEPLLMKSIFQGDYSCSLLLVNLGRDLTQPHWPVELAPCVNGCLEISANTHQTSCVCTYLKAAQTDKERFLDSLQDGYRSWLLLV